MGVAVNEITLFVRATIKRGSGGIRNARDGERAERKKKKEELEGAEQMVRRVRERKLLIQAFSCSPVISRLQINPANWFVP